MSKPKSGAGTGGVGFSLPIDINRPVALLGYSSTLEDCPYWDNREWQLWGLNGLHRRIMASPVLSRHQRADLWFQIHPPEGCNDEEMEWMDGLGTGECTVPTVVRAADMDYWSKRLPLAAKAGLLHPFPQQVVDLNPGGWFANTFCLEMALALSAGVKHIAVFGVECTSMGRELAVERPAFAFWLGAAMALGAKIEIPVGATLRPYQEVYGLEYKSEALKAAQVTSMIIPDQMLENINVDRVEDAVALPDNMEEAEEIRAKLPKPPSNKAGSGKVIH